MFKKLVSSNNFVQHMLIKTQKEVFTNLAGDNSSKRRGEGYDFMELREYQSGEDIKHIDWVISAKVGAPYVKIFHQERELNVVIAPVLSATTHFGTKRLKSEFINEICALIAYGCVKQNDSFESFICNSDIYPNTKKSKQMHSVRVMAEKIASYNVLGKQTQWELLSKKLFSHIIDRSLVFLIGDFFDAQEFNLGVLAARHEVIAVIVRDRFEEKPSMIGEMNIVDPVTKRDSYVNFDKKNITLIEMKVLQNDELLYEKLNRANVRFIKIYSDENPAEKILTLMNF